MPTLKAFVSSDMYTSSGHLLSSRTWW